MGLCDLTWWSFLTLVVIFGREFDRLEFCSLQTLKCSLKSVPSYESSPDSSTSYSRKTRSTYSSQAFCLCSPKNLSAKPEFTLFISFLWKERLFIVRKWLLYRLCTNHMARHFRPPDPSAIKMHCSCMLIPCSNPLSPCPPSTSCIFVIQSIPRTRSLGQHRLSDRPNGRLSESSGQDSVKDKAFLKGDLNF